MSAQSTLFTTDAPPPPSPVPTTTKEDWKHLSLYREDQDARETNKTMMVTTAGRLLVLTLDELRTNW